MKPKSKQYIETRKQYIDKIITAGLTKKTAANAMKLFSEFKLEKILKMDIIRNREEEIL